MSIEELRHQVREKLGPEVFVRERLQDGKAIVEVGVEVPWGERRKGYVKGTTFNAAGIPQDAVAKIERAIQ